MLFWGHGFGEYAALVVAGSLGFEDALRLTSFTAKAAMRAGRGHGGGMASVGGLETERVERICNEGSAVWMAGYDSPTDSVVSGTDVSLGSISRPLRSAGARFIRSDSRLALHTLLMRDATREIRTMLDEIESWPPGVPFISSIDSASHEDLSKIRDLLVALLISSVRFEAALRTLETQSINQLLEVGPADGLTKICCENPASNRRQSSE